MPPSRKEPRGEVEPVSMPRGSWEVMFSSLCLGQAAQGPLLLHWVPRPHLGPKLPGEGEGTLVRTKLELQRFTEFSCPTQSLEFPLRSVKGFQRL